MFKRESRFWEGALYIFKREGRFWKGGVDSGRVLYICLRKRVVSGREGFILGGCFKGGCILGGRFRESRI